MAAMITVHLVLNAHIDPVWLWPWQAGVDEVLATCRSACNRLDRHPDIVFTHGDAWTYHIVERLDPSLFQRIQAHVAAGRWEITGGWWIQPDCNQPTGIGLSRQIQLGKEYFLSRFQAFPRTGFNVDSFGHAASLPRIMRQHGQDRYVMMRPQEHEMDLPARVFRWRGSDCEDAVTTFRIAAAYATVHVAEEHVLASLQDLPPGLSHTMCFIGLGDHGGGPTERQIEWCRAHARSIPGCRLVFSSPSQFFDAVEEEAPELPRVTGELHYHAIGCYSVMRPVKVAMRRAEHQLQQAEITAEIDPRPDPETKLRLKNAWQQVCFNQFHDTLGGSCIPSAYGQILDQLGAATAVADEIIHFSLRRRLTTLPDDAHQRIVLFNASQLEFDGYVILAPWTEEVWKNSWQIVDEAGAVIPYQLMGPEAAAHYRHRVLLRVAIAPRELKTLLIERVVPKRIAPVSFTAVSPSVPMKLTFGATIASIGARPCVTLANDVLLQAELELFEDFTDTWSHSADRLGGQFQDSAQWLDPMLLDDGPLMKSAVQQGVIGQSSLVADWRVYADDPVVELILRVNWHASHQVLKLSFPLKTSLEGHSDGIPGGVLRRRPDGREYPIRDYTWLHFAKRTAIAIICPDVFALDASRKRLRLTLLRSPLMAHHTAPVEAFPRANYADQGVHEFRFQFVAGSTISLPWLERRAAMLQLPPVSADWTKGMEMCSRW